MKEILKKNYRKLKGTKFWFLTNTLYRKYLISKFVSDFNNPAKKNSTIKEVYVEFTNFCNLNCKWCLLERSREKVYLKKEIFEKFLKNIIYDKRFKGVKNLRLWGIGESLLHPDFISMLKLLKKYKELGLKENKYFPKITLSTNATLLTKDLSEKIINIGILDEIRFSIDGGSKEKFEEIRIGAKWERVHQNLLNFYNLNKNSRNRVKIIIVCIIDTKDYNLDFMTPEFKKVFDLADQYDLRCPHNWDGSNDLNIPRELRHLDPVSKICFSLMHSLMLLADGKVTVCCIDWRAAGIIGDLKKSDLYEIYNSKKRRYIIETILKGEKSKISLCKDCELLS